MPSDIKRCECSCGCRYPANRWERIWKAQEMSVRTTTVQTTWFCVRCAQDRHTAYEQAVMSVAGRNTTNA